VDIAIMTREPCLVEGKRGGRPAWVEKRKNRTEKGHESLDGKRRGKKKRKRRLMQKKGGNNHSLMGLGKN